MRRYTNAALPYQDSTTTSLSVFAQFLLTYKVIDNWTLWIVADILYLWIYSTKQLYPTALLYFVFLVLSIMGYREWRADMARAAEAVATDRIDRHTT
jgi:nicotinamide mononucleotide transporter